VTRPPARPLSREPWPSPGDPRNPYTEPPHLELDAAWADYQNNGGALSRADHDDAVRAFVQAWEQAWSEGHTDRLVPHLGPLLLGGPRLDDHRRFGAVHEAATVEQLVRIATDLVPATGNAAPDRLLGPWSSTVDARSHPLLFRAASAHGAFLLPDDLPMSAFRRWAGRSPVPPVSLRAAVRAVLQAPLSAYPVLGVDGDRVVLGSGVGDLPAPGAVLADTVACVPGVQGPSPGTVMLTRVVDLPTGARAVAPLLAPGPLPEAAEAWVDLLTLRHRLHGRRASTADVLRHRGHVLVRCVLEAAWLR
jgi:hypothetical protein